jgi:eukaryotic-like serine/threonine-protein kinase
MNVASIADAAEKLCGEDTSLHAEALGLIERQRELWRQGNHVLIENLPGVNLARLDKEHLLDILFNEVVLREQCGERVTSEDYITRFPECAREIGHLLQMHRSLTSGSVAYLGTQAPRSEVSPAPGTPLGEAQWQDKTISHYRVGARIGIGGMGEVYLAEDLALGRRAALKVLPANFSSALRNCLLRETRTSARLQHPGIATFYDAGDENGAAFIAMEFIEGETLRQRLKRGPLPVEESISMAAKLLEALAHAHAIGIVHRDLKPENIMLAPDGSPRLLDFGIAQQILFEEPLPAAGLASESGPESGFRSGVAGTPGYMAPEQIRGQAVDARSDLFALGVMLLESISGCAPFRKTTWTASLAATLAQEVSPTGIDLLSPELQTIVRRAISRDPTTRYESALAFLASLRQLGLTETTSRLPQRIAVLDFETRPSAAENGWIGFAAADALRKTFAESAELHIITRERIIRTRTASEGVPAITDLVHSGLILGCRWLLAGAVEQFGTHFRIEVRLVEVLAGKIAWTDQVEGPLEDLFVMQQRISAGVLERLKLQPPPSSAAQTPQNVRVYECCIRGVQLMWRMDKHSMQQAEELFAQAVALDAHCARALAGLAAIHALRYIFTTDPRTLELAESLALRAIEADGELSEPHHWIGYIRMNQGRFVEGFLAHQRATELDPGNHAAFYFMGACLSLFSGRTEAMVLCERMTGRLCQDDPHRWRREEALKFLRHSIELEPQHNWTWLALALTHLDLENLREAEWGLHQALELEGRGLGNWQGMAGFLAECLRRRGALEEARAHCLTGLDAVEKSDNAYRDTFRGTFLCTLGLVALQQQDVPAALAAFSQALLHLRGRPKARGAGHLVVRALAGTARATGDLKPFDEALCLFRDRGAFHFGAFWGCMEHLTLLDLSRTARAIGRMESAQQLLREAIDAGSLEAAREAAVC